MFEKLLIHPFWPILSWPIIGHFTSFYFIWHISIRFDFWYFILISILDVYFAIWFFTVSLHLFYFKCLGKFLKAISVGLEGVTNFAFLKISRDFLTFFTLLTHFDAYWHSVWENILVPYGASFSEQHLYNLTVLAV